MSGYCGKGFLYFYNLIFLAISGVCVYLSVLFVWKWGDYAILVANTYSVVPAGIIFIFGIIILIAGIVGLCGTCSENRCTLGVFFSLLLLLLTMEIVGGTLTYVKKQDIETGLKNNLWKAFNQYHDEHSSTRKPFDKMQTQLECCGVLGPDNWTNSSTPYAIPDSCCIHDIGKRCYTFQDNIYQKGCYNKLKDVFNQNVRYIMGVLVGFAILQFIGMMMTVYLIVVLKRAGYMRMLEYAPKA